MTHPAQTPASVPVSDGAEPGPDAGDGGDFGTWIKRCKTCGTTQVAQTYDQFVALSREHKGHLTTVEPSHAR